jgi:hypothetical protein
MMLKLMLDRSLQHCLAAFAVWRFGTQRDRIRLGVCAAEEMLARAGLADRVHCPPVLRQVDAGQQRVRHAGLVDVHDDLLVAHRQAAFEIENKRNARPSARFTERCRSTRCRMRRPTRVEECWSFEQRAG